MRGVPPRGIALLPLRKVPPRFLWKSWLITRTIGEENVSFLAYDKLRHILGKIVKRDARMADRTAQEEQGPADAPAALPVSPEREYGLAQIAKRRGLAR